MTENRKPIGEDITPEEKEKITAEIERIKSSRRRIPSSEKTEEAARVSSVFDPVPDRIESAAVVPPPIPHKEEVVPAGKPPVEVFPEEQESPPPPEIEPPAVKEKKPRISKKSIKAEPPPPPSFPETDGTKETPAAKVGGDDSLFSIEDIEEMKNHKSPSLKFAESEEEQEADEDDEEEREEGGGLYVRVIRRYGLTTEEHSVLTPTKTDGTIVDGRIGFTVFLGECEYARVDVGAHLPIRKQDIVAGYRTLWKIVKAELKTEILKIRGECPTKITKGDGPSD